MTFTEDYICKRLYADYDLDPCTKDFPALYKSVKEALHDAIEVNSAQLASASGDDWVGLSFDTAELSARLTLLINGEKVLLNIHERWTKGEIEA